jgi:protein-tyrosine phosphatase
LDADTRHFARALEDLPEDARHRAAEIAGSQPGTGLGQRIRDELETVAFDSYGNLERAPLLHFLSRYPVTPYTYQVSAVVSRGQRPDARKLADLAGRHGYRATINLCAEVAEGDQPAIAKAGLAGTLRTHHVPVTDMEPPTLAQVTEVLDLLSGPGAELTYVHCEAGKGRTGVAVACYRMAVLGWSAADALGEAVNFGCCIPRQQAFIENFGQLLLSGSPALGRYPLQPPGSVAPTPEQLAATVRTAAEPA